MLVDFGHAYFEMIRQRNFVTNLLPYLQLLSSTFSYTINKHRWKSASFLSEAYMLVMRDNTWFNTTKRCNSMFVELARKVVVF